MSTHTFDLVEPIESYATGRSRYPEGVIASDTWVHIGEKWYRPDDALAFATSIASAALAVKAAQS